MSWVSSLGPWMAGPTSRWPIPPTLARVAALRAPNAARGPKRSGTLMGTPAPRPLLRHDRDEFHRRVGEIFTGMPAGRYPFHIASSALFLPAITVRQAIDKVRVAEPDDDARGEVVHRRALMRRDRKTNHRNGFVFKHQPAYELRRHVAVVLGQSRRQPANSEERSQNRFHGFLQR